MKRFLMSMLITILAVSVVFCGVYFARQFFGGDISLSGEKEPSLNKKNILLMGVDKDKTRSDTMMLVCIDPDNNTVKILSIPRDTRIKVSDTKHDKINHLMGYKNPQETVIKAVENLTRIPVTDYCTITFEGFRNIIDALGGVEFDVPINMNYDDPAQDLHIHVNKGFQVLDGKAAEGVVRFRHSYVNGDLGRIDMQQNFIKALFEQKLTPSYILKAPKILNEVYDNVDTSISLADALKYISMAKKLDFDSLDTFEIPGEGKYISGVSYFIAYEQQLKDLILYEFRYPEEEARLLPTPSPKPKTTKQPKE